MSGKQVRLFLVDGSVGGLITAEIFNWTGHVLKGKRTELARILKRDEASRTGVYILFGTNDNDEPYAYIGEGDNVGSRVKRHNDQKTFWDEVVLITSKDSNLTKAHVRYLEAEFCALAQSIGRYQLDNGNSPGGGATLPEADESDMRYFISQIQILMPVLGFNIFRGRTVSPRATTNSSDSALAPSQIAVQPASETAELPAATPDTNSPIFHLSPTRLGVNARAQIIDGEFTLLAGSEIAATMRIRKGANESTLRQFKNRETTHRKVLESSERGSTPELIRTTKDFVFSSPSAAAALAYGQAARNGRTAWLTEDGRSYGVWEAGAH